MTRHKCGGTVPACPLGKGLDYTIQASVLSSRKQHSIVGRKGTLDPQPSHTAIQALPHTRWVALGRLLNSASTASSVKWDKWLLVSWNCWEWNEVIHVKNVRSGLCWDLWEEVGPTEGGRISEDTGWKPRVCSVSQPTGKEAEWLGCSTLWKPWTLGLMAFEQGIP